MKNFVQKSLNSDIFRVYSFSISSNNEKFPKIFQQYCYFLGYCASNLGIFRGLKSKSWYF